MKFKLRKHSIRILLIFTFLISLSSSTVIVQAAPDNKPLKADPPYSGTIFIDPDIITSSDPTTFVSLVYTGRGLRSVFDRRVDDFIDINAYLFNASFDDGLTIEVQVNPEFGSMAAALVEAEKYAEEVGRLPTILRTDVNFLWIHQGVQPFGGGNNSILIHTGQSASYETEGILEETLVHEAAHTSLDADHASAAGWLLAQTQDNGFISTYALGDPSGEDIAESFLTYLAVHYKPDRISELTYDTILQTIPNRIAYFDSKFNNMYPLQNPTTFTDVPIYYWSQTYIESIYDAGITGGCATNPLRYCPNGTVTRAQMAVFLMKGLEGSSYTPPPATGTIFNDVSSSSFAAAFIEAFSSAGITGGCTVSPANFCPDGFVTRAQMAVFLLKAKHGSSYTPPATTGTMFSDVPSNAFAAAWIEQLATEGITGGCGGGNYCPNVSVTRAQMAVFLQKTFNLP